jgi:hypothetical protein
MDDGAADYAGVTIQTHGFQYEETVRLAADLRSEYSLEAGVRKNRGSWLIYIPARSVRDLEDVVGDHMIPSLAYKLIPRRSRTP